MKHDLIRPICFPLYAQCTLLKCTTQREDKREQSQTSIFLLSDKPIQRPRIIREVLDSFKPAPQNYGLIDPECTFYCLLFPNGIFNYKVPSAELKSHRVKTTHFHFSCPRSEKSSLFTDSWIWFHQSKILNVCSMIPYFPLRKPETMAGIHSKFSHSTRLFLRELQRLCKETVNMYISLWNWQLSFISSNILAKDPSLLFSVHRLPAPPPPPKKDCIR